MLTDMTVDQNIGVSGRTGRLASLAGVVLLHLLIGWALLLGLAPHFTRSPSEALSVFEIPAEPPPPPVVEVEPTPVEREKVRAEPATEGRATPIPRPPTPMVRTPVKASEDVSPAVAAGLIPANSGSGAGSASSGGGGIGSGSGAGTGSGTKGSGTGGGGAVARARLRGGSITPRDYPRQANGAQGMVVARLDVDATGQVTACRVTRSSGNAILDATTCRLIRERFRFTPARDAAGNAVPDVQGWQQRWWRD